MVKHLYFKFQVCFLGSSSVSYACYIIWSVHKSIEYTDTSSAYGCRLATHERGMRSPVSSRAARPFSTGWILQVSNIPLGRHYLSLPYRTCPQSQAVKPFHKLRSRCWKCFSNTDTTLLVPPNPPLSPIHLNKCPLNIQKAQRIKFGRKI